MWFPVFVGASSVVLGSLLALAPGASTRRLGPFQSFALLSSVAVVLGQLLPDALSSAGLPALLVFGASFAAPRTLEWVRQRLSGESGSLHGMAHGHDDGPCSNLGLELGYAAFLLHSAADGVGLSVFGGSTFDEGMHVDVVLAIAAHTVPVTAMVIMAFEVRHGLRGALMRSALVLAATLAGMGLPFALDPHMLHEIEPWLAAATGGLLLHVVSHGWAPDGPPTPLGHVMDFAALVAAGALFLVGGGGHNHGGHNHGGHNHGGHNHGSAHAAGEHAPEFRERMIEALWELGLETAPMLLFGLLVAAVVQAHGSRLNPRFLQGGGQGGQALRGAVLGLPLPVCACGILPVAQSLRTRGAAPAFVVAFLLSTPELGLDTFALTGRFLGFPFAVVRLVAAVLIAVVAAWLLAKQAPERTAAIPAVRVPAKPIVRRDVAGGWFAETMHHFEDLLYHVGAWTLVGLLGAAYVQAVLSPHALSGFGDYGLDIFVVTLLAVPGYVCASSATPLAAVLLAKGLSPGAVLAGLLLGPATNLGTLGFLRRAYGFRASAFGIGGLLLATWALACGVNTWLPTLAVPNALAPHTEHGWLAYASGLILVVLVLRAVWRSGLRTWLSSLGEVLVQGEEAGAVRVDDYAHGHHPPGHHHH